MQSNYLNTELCYSVLLKKYAGSEEEGDKADVQKLFGYIGLFTLLGLWWLGEWNSTSMIYFNFYIISNILAELDYIGFILSETSDSLHFVLD